jgi:hypothetical protein
MAHFRFNNAWSRSARIDKRFRDPPVDSANDVGPAPEPSLSSGTLPLTREIVLERNSAGRAMAQAVAPSWGTWHCGRRTKTGPILAEALELRAQGWSWPRIAAKFKVHRMALYHALRREQH